MLAQAHAQHGLTFQLGFELEFYLLHKPERAALAAAMQAALAQGAAAQGSAARPALLPLPFDAHNYSSSSGFDGAAEGGWAGCVKIIAGAEEACNGGAVWALVPATAGTKLLPALPIPCFFRPPPTRSPV